MYSRRQRSTRNAAAATNSNVNSNARTTRGRTNKAKHPRRGGGNPDTARVRASIERPPVVPWVKVMRPPALHLRRTFLVEKWVRPSDLTATEREVYDSQHKEKEKERQRLLKWQQEKRDEEEKERNELKQRENEEKEKLAVSEDVEISSEKVRESESNVEKREKDDSAAKSTPTTLEPAQSQTISCVGTAGSAPTTSSTSLTPETQNLEEQSAATSMQQKLENKTPIPPALNTTMIENDKNMKEQTHSMIPKNDPELTEASGEKQQQPQASADDIAMHLTVQKNDPESSEAPIQANCSVAATSTGEEKQQSQSHADDTRTHLMILENDPESTEAPVQADCLIAATSTGEKQQHPQSHADDDASPPSEPLTKKLKVEHSE